jgi:hypothetical protein
LCNQRRARRACPALGRHICAVCCGTKRLTEIACPADCVYLASAREHPAAAVRRQQERDVARLTRMLRDLGDRQSEVLLAVMTHVARHEDPAELQALIDEDVIDAAAALAATFETAARGVIYEHRPASRPAARLMASLKQHLADLGRRAGSAFEREAAVVLRRIEEAAREARASEPDNRRAFLAWLRRVLEGLDALRTGPAADAPGSSVAEAPSGPDAVLQPRRLILPGG